MYKYPAAAAESHRGAFASCRYEFDLKVNLYIYIYTHICMWQNTYIYIHNTMYKYPAAAAESHRGAASLAYATGTNSI